MNLAALESYFTLMTANGSLRVYQTAKSSGFFDVLQNGPASLEEVANKCATEIAPTQLVLEALEPLHLIVHVEGKYILGPAAPLVLGQYGDLGDSYWTHLPTLLKHNEPLMKIDNAAESEAYYREQALSLAWMMKGPAEAAVHYLGIGKELKNQTILDVGAGTAVWSLTMAMADSGSQVTALDWPGVLPLATAQAQKMGISDRLKTMPGNYFEMDLPASAFDLVLLGNVCHLETEKSNQVLFERLLHTLKPGGSLVVFDIFSGQQAGDLTRTLYALGLALRTVHAGLHSSASLEDLLERAGFVDISFSPLEVPPFVMGMVKANK